jgi:hypothetical protein
MTRSRPPRSAAIAEARVALLDERSAPADPGYETPGGPEQTPFDGAFLQSGKLYAVSR